MLPYQWPGRSTWKHDVHVRRHESSYGLINAFPSHLGQCTTKWVAISCRVVPGSANRSWSLIVLQSFDLSKSFLIRLIYHTNIPQRTVFKTQDSGIRFGSEIGKPKFNAHRIFIIRANRDHLILFQIERRRKILRSPCSVSYTHLTLPTSDLV